MRAAILHRKLGLAPLLPACWLHHTCCGTQIWVPSYPCRRVPQRLSTAHDFPVIVCALRAAILHRKLGLAPLLPACWLHHTCCGTQIWVPSYPCRRVPQRLSTAHDFPVIVCALRAAILHRKLGLAPLLPACWLHHTCCGTQIWVPSYPCRRVPQRLSTAHDFPVIVRALRAAILHRKLGLAPLLPACWLHHTCCGTQIWVPSYPCRRVPQRLSTAHDFPVIVCALRAAILHRKLGLAPLLPACWLHHTCCGTQIWVPSYPCRRVPQRLSTAHDFPVIVCALRAAILHRKLGLAPLLPACWLHHTCCGTQIWVPSYPCRRVPQRLSTAHDFPVMFARCAHRFSRERVAIRSIRALTCLDPYVRTRMPRRGS